LLTSGRFNVTVATPRSSRLHKPGLSGIALSLFEGFPIKPGHPPTIL